MNRKLLFCFLLGFCIPLFLIGQYAEPIDGFNIAKDYTQSCSRNFGKTCNHSFGDYHLGFDVGLPKGTTVKAVLDGEVIYFEPNEPGYGSPTTAGGRIVIKHQNDNGQFFYAEYGHLDNMTSYKTLKKGDWIGKLNNYGGSPHLHFGINTSSTFPVRPRGYGSSLGNWVHPRDYLQKYCNSKLANFLGSYYHKQVNKQGYKMIKFNLSRYTKTNKYDNQDLLSKHFTNVNNKRTSNLGLYTGYVTIRNTKNQDVKYVALGQIINNIGNTMLIVIAQPRNGVFQDINLINLVYDGSNYKLYMSSSVGYADLIYTLGK